MKGKILGAILTAAAFGTISILGGCATIKHEMSAKAPTGELEKAQSDMKQALVQVDATTASLNTLVKPDQVALKDAFEEYQKNVNQMDKLAKKVDDNDAELRTQGREYFSQLQQKETGYTDENLRKASIERRTQLNDIYSKVPQANAQMKEALTHYMAQLKQIQAYLDTDLTPDGIQAMRPVAQKAASEGESFKDLAKPVISAMSDAITAMTPGSEGAAAGGKQR